MSVQRLIKHKSDWQNRTFFRKFLTNFQRYTMYIVLNSIIQKPLFHCAPQSRRMKLTLQNEKRLAMLTELLKLCKYFVLYYPFPNIIIIIQHNNWQISIFGLYFFVIQFCLCPSLYGKRFLPTNLAELQALGTRDHHLYITFFTPNNG